MTVWSFTPSRIGIIASSKVKGASVAAGADCGGAAAARGAASAASATVTNQCRMFVDPPESEGDLVRQDAAGIKPGETWSSGRVLVSRKGAKILVVQRRRERRERR
jgi:hypothetical protein